MKSNLLAVLLLAAPALLTGSEAELSIGRGTDGKVQQLTATGVPAGTRLQLVEGVAPISVVTADKTGKAHFATAWLPPGPHAIQAVEWSTGKKVGALLHFVVPIQPAETFNTAALATGTRADVATIGDLEGDGFSDLIFFNETAGNVMRMPNVNGVFGTPVQLAAVSGPTALIVGDFNGDGRNDVAITTVDGRVAILMNKGHGSFSAAQYFAAGSNPSSLVSADFNSDGIPDLAVANRESNDVSILSGNGDGTFMPAVAFATGRSPRSILLTDIDGDGIADLVTANFESNDVSLLLGDGKGSFRNGGTFATGNGPVRVLSADFNGDGATDLAVLNQIDGTAVILLNQFSLTSGAKAFRTVSTIPAVAAFAVGDVDGDGNTDLFIQAGDQFYVRLGSGDGSFAEAYKVAAAAPSLLLLLNDFNHDGRMDAAALDMSGTFSILSGSDTSPEAGQKFSNTAVGSSTGTTRTKRFQPLVSSPTPSSISFTSSPNPLRYGQPVTLTATVSPSAATGFVTFYYGTSILGTATLSGGQATVTTLLLSSGMRFFKSYYSGDINYGSSSSVSAVSFVSSTLTTGFQPQVTYGTGGTGTIGGNPKSIALADFNGDGKADIVTANSGGSISVLLGNSNGTFQTAFNMSAPSVPSFIATGDFNGDGKVDFAVANFGGSVGVYLGKGDGTFQTPVYYTAGSQPFSIAVADFNGDGKADLAVASKGSNTVSVLFGVGNGVFQTAVNYSVGAGPAMIVAADLNNDGTPDLATTNSNGSSISVLIANSNGTFHPAVTYAAGSTPTGLAVADVTGDGNLDLVATNAVDNTVSVLPGVGDGTFQAQILSNTHTGPVYVTVLDLNQDGKADLIVANVTSNDASVLFGNGNGTFLAPVNFSTGNGPYAISLGDFNGDGMPDLGVVNFSPGNASSAAAVSVLLGDANLLFVPVTPCRIADTRQAAGQFGSPSISGQTTRTFTIPASSCNIPATAQAYSMNVTVVPQGPLGYLTMWPTGQAQPYTSTLNSDGRIKSNAAIIPAGVNGAINAFASNTTDLVLDINGYFIPAFTTAALSFYPLTPCRISDTRTANGTFGGPFIAGGTTRTLPIISSSCGIPMTAQAYSLNFTAVPRLSQLGYITTWPTGQAQPYTSTLNAPTGQITANAALVPAGTSGAVNIFASNDTDLVVDVNGYFAPTVAGGLSYYAFQPCRVLDTRLQNGSPFVGTMTVPVTGSVCVAPAAAQAFVFNATVVPPGSFSYLTLWPSGGTQPYVSTLNDGDGSITGNMAIVPTTNGSINAFASQPTHLILDLFGYFAP